MWILAVDTAAAHGSVALVRDNELIEERALHAPEGFGAMLIDEIQMLLHRQNLALPQIDVYAGGAGPGSFTGIRVGLAAIKGLAATMQKPAVGISNLQALAACGHGNLRAPVIDARRGEVYGALYGASLQLLAPEVVTTFANFLAHLPAQPVEFISPGFKEFRAELAASRLADSPVRDEQFSLAGAIGRIAYSLALGNKLSAPAAVDANYVRRSDAELFWKES